MSFYNTAQNLNNDFSSGVNVFTPALPPAAVMPDTSSIFLNPNLMNFNIPPLNLTLPVFDMFSFDSFKMPDFDTFKINSNKTSKTENFKAVGNKQYAELKDYNKSAGEKLANIALRNAVGCKHLCATYVKNAIRDAGLGKYIPGDAYMMTSILSKNKNFKQIPVNSVNVNDLPAGCVLVFDKGMHGYSAKYGHTEITTGDGRAVSDFINNKGIKKPSAIFIPV